MKHIPGNIKIVVKIVENSKISANVTITINCEELGYITLKGFTIWKSNTFNERINDSLNITPPLKHIHGKWINQIFVEKTENWYKLESMIYSEFIRIKQQIDEDNLNLDEIHEAMSS